MTKKTKVLKNSEEIEIPFEIFQYSLKEMERQQRYLWVQYGIAMFLLLAVVSALIALPLLVPVLAIATNLAIFLTLGILCAVGISIWALCIRLGVIRDEFNFHFETKSIQVSFPIPFEGLSIGFSNRYTLSKIQKNNSEYTLITTDRAPSLDSSYYMQSEIISLLKQKWGIRDIMAEKIDSLKAQKNRLAKEVEFPENLKNTTAREKLEKKFSALTQAITHYEHQWTLLESALAQLELKNEILNKPTTLLEKLNYPLYKLYEIHKIQEKIDQLEKDKKKFPKLYDVFSDRKKTLEKKLHLILSSVANEINSLLPSIDCIKEELKKMKNNPEIKDPTFIDNVLLQIDKEIAFMHKRILNKTNNILYSKYFQQQAIEQHALKVDPAFSYQTPLLSLHPSPSSPETNTTPSPPSDSPEAADTNMPKKP